MPWCGTDWSVEPRQHAYIRFGRGRGNGTGARSTTPICTRRRVGWNEDGATKDATGSSDGGLRTAGDFWMEPVSSSWPGSCFPPLLIFRSANMLKTRIATATVLSTVLRPGVSQGTTKTCRIARAPNREGAPLSLWPPAGRKKSYSAALNKFLGIYRGLAWRKRGRCPLRAFLEPSNVSVSYLYAIEFYAWGEDILSGWVHPSPPRQVIPMRTGASSLFPFPRPWKGRCRLLALAV